MAFQSTNLRAWLIAAAVVLSACGDVDRRDPDIAETIDPLGPDPVGVNAAAGGAATEPPTPDGAPSPAEDAEAPAGRDSMGNESTDIEDMMAGTPSTPARLTANTESFAFGLVEAASGEEVAFDWVITNSGGADTGPLTLTAPTNPLFSVTNGCMSLAASASCTIAIRFSTAVAGDFAGLVRLQSSTEAVEVALSGRGQYRLTVSVTGRGEVTSAPVGLTCGEGTCTGLFDPGNVTLTAQTTNGSGSFLSHWDAENCRARRSCPLRINSTRSIGVRFSEMANNLIFTSSETFPTILGSLAAYDAACNRLATAAGINDAAGDAFIAAMSNSARSLRQRLGAARAWVRMDGFPVADTAAELFAGGMRYHIAYDETGLQVPLPLRAGGTTSTLTGTLQDGSSAPDNCNDWTSTAAEVSVQQGDVTGGPDTWLQRVSLSCALDDRVEHHVTCMGIRRTAPLTQASTVVRSREGGKLIWVTNTAYQPGTLSPEAKCQSERPTGVALARAFVAYSDQPAAAVLDPEANYFRPDDALVGSGAELALTDVWASPWVLADGTVVPELFEQVFTGADNPTSLPKPGQNCDDWTDSTLAGRATFGDYGIGSSRFFNTFGTRPCSFTARLYCVEL